MTDTAAAQLRRILYVIPQLADDRAHSLAEIAVQMGVDVATVRNDLWSLVTRYQEPGGFVEGVQLYLESDQVSLVSNHFRRPMRLTGPELCALELGLAMLRAESPPDEHAAIYRARERLRSVLAKLPGDAIADGLRSGVLGAAGSGEHLAAVRSALRARRRIRLTYRPGASATATDRTVCPYALVAANGMFYVVAYCDTNEGIRIFRLDRIEATEPTTDRFEVPADFSLDDVLQDGKAFIAARVEKMRVRYSPAIARWISEREGVSPEADGSVIVEHAVADRDWAVRHVLQYGPDAEVAEPAELRDEVRQTLKRMKNEE